METSHSAFRIPHSAFESGSFSLEYAALIAVVVAALIGMSVYLKRSLSGKWRTVGDTFGFGKQYDPTASAGGGGDLPDGECVSCTGPSNTVCQGMGCYLVRSSTCANGSHTWTFFTSGGGGGCATATICGDPGGDVCDSSCCSTE